MSCKDTLENYLNAQHVPFQVHQHPIAYTAQDVAAREHLPGKQVAKVVMAFADGQPVMLVVPAPYRVDLLHISQVLGAATCRLANEAEMRRLFPDCDVGAMPPFGNLYQLPVYVDQHLEKDEYITFNLGTHTQTMRLSYADFARLVKPTVTEFVLPMQEALR